MYDFNLIIFVQPKKLEDKSIWTSLESNSCVEINVNQSEHRDLPLWKLSVELEASPKEILNEILAHK